MRFFRLASPPLDFLICAEMQLLERLQCPQRRSVCEFVSAPTEQMGQPSQGSPVWRVRSAPSGLPALPIRAPGGRLEPLAADSIASKSRSCSRDSSAHPRRQSGGVAQRAAVGPSAPARPRAPRATRATPTKNMWRTHKKGGFAPTACQSAAAAHRRGRHRRRPGHRPGDRDGPLRRRR